MKERAAMNLVERFPDWIGEFGLEKGRDKGTYAWAMVKAQILVSKIQWFIHVLYLKGYEIRKVKK